MQPTQSLTLVDAATAGSVDSRSPVDVILLELRFDAAFDHTSLTVDCIHDPRILNTMRRLVAANDVMGMLELGAIHVHVLGAVLNKAGMHLDGTVQEALERASALGALQRTAKKHRGAMDVPELDVRDILIAIKILLHATGTVDVALLTARVGDLINSNVSRGHQELWAIAQKFGCTDNGFESTLKHEHVLTMAEAMLAALGRGAATDSSDDEMPPVVVKCELVVDDQPPRPTIQMPMSHLVQVVAKPDKATELPGLVWYTLKHRLSLVKELYGASGSQAQALAPQPSRL